MRAALRLLALALALILPLPALSQEADQVALFADNLRYETGTGDIVASGNVEVYYGTARLTADAIRYNQAANRITAEGQIRLETPEGAVILASLVELSADFRDGLIRGARLILNEQFQVAAVEGARSGGNLNTLYKTVASSCVVCARNPTPIWRIRAQEVVYDEARQRLYFRNAWFDAFGIPFFYLPRVSIPEPGVRRATGFLVPTLSNSQIYGGGVKVPYYITLGDHSDLTLTPFLTTSGGRILEAEYRRRFRAGQIESRGAFALADGLAGSDNRWFIEADGAFALPRDLRAEFSLNRASDRSFMGQFNYSDADRLTSYASLNRYRANDFFDIRTEAYQTLRDAEPQGQIPFVIPKADYRRVWYNSPIGGTLGVTGGFLGLARTAGRDVLRASAGVDWRRDTTLGNGMQLSSLFDLGAEAYQVGDDAAFTSETLYRATPTLGAELRWPFARFGEGATHIVEPVAQLLYSDTLGDLAVPNEDSLLPELDETNLFAINRFPGLDARESGLRLNYGLNYERIGNAGWDLGITVGQVLRTEADTAFSAGSGLRTAGSDYVAALSFAVPPRFSVIGRSLFDTSFGFRRGELEFEYTRPRFDFATSYTYLASDNSDPVLGAVPKREEIGFATRYRLRPNWEIEGEWRYDIAEERSIFGGAGLTYGNECVEIGLSLARRYTTSNNVTPSTEIALQVTLAGLGSGGGSGNWPVRQCGKG